MELYILVAKLYGAVMIALGLGVLFNLEYYRKAFAEIMKNRTFVFFGGIMALVIGMLVVMNHNIWEWSLVLIATIFGWLALIKGAALMIFPKFVGLFEGWFSKKSFLLAIGIGTTVAGALLSYVGWMM